MTAPALELRDLSKSFGLAKIIQGVDLKVAKGERHAIIGPNGAGKSTLFNLITGKYAPTSGGVYLHGENVSGLKPFEINRRGLSRSFQITNIFPNMTVFENIRCGLLWTMGYKYSFWHMISGQQDVTEKAEEILEQINLTSRRDLLAGTLAYAEQRALEIGITIAGGADIILLDEPCAGMSHSETALIVDLIRKVTEDKTLMIVEHDMGVIFDLADKISVLVYGEIIESDVPDAVRASVKVKEAYLGTTLEDEGV
ncbi:ABC transporter ATP-binding protein [Phaeobacter gallaeciensis]|uniref:ABC transporter ATP-binding protein n=2 Tax=Roseobacteraceae TaxID=2854170 RepID=A0A366X7W8_9RHOB|nr:MULTISPECIES: ABC transporter ATP-binding protein [Roseobacteraceae]MBT3142583.1 ABC transporter ATP-binding protein [Falsiruegeria litorea]MBT8170987.1 ABC transporter ATP-binding protein [Falsiruegeria litorea]RBW58394.1 ABC transporter ATP-binding protein [Phaeobacter gallaeciensis]